MLIIGSYKEKTRQQVYAYLNSYRREIEDKLNKEYDDAFPGWQGNLYSVTRQFEKWLNQTLSLELKEILLQEEKSFEIISSAKNHLTFYLKSFRERLNHNLEQALGVQAKLEALEVVADEIKKPDISISRTFDSHIEMFWFLFPMFLFRNIFRCYFKKQIYFEIDKNLHRLTSDLNAKINKEMDHLMNQALVYMNAELAMIEALLCENKGASDYIQSRMDHIKVKFENL